MFHKYHQNNENIYLLYNQLDQTDIHVELEFSFDKNHHKILQ